MKRIINLALVFLLLVSGIVPSYAEPSANELNKNAIKWDNMSIISKDDWIINHNAPIKKSELSVVLNNIMAFQQKSENTFNISDDQWYLDYMLKTQHANLILPSNGQLAPYSNISREEAVTIIAKALGLQITSSQKDSGYFDNESISVSSIPYIRAMKDAGYLSFEKNFLPKQAITKAEILAILNSSIEEIYDTPGIYNQNISTNLVINSKQVRLKDITINGNLILSEGIGRGKVYLDNVKVKGRTIVRGSSAVHAANCNLGDIVIANRDGETAVILDENSISSSLIVTDDSKNATFTGATTSITLNSEESILNLVNVQVDKVELVGKGAILSIDKGTSTRVVNITGKEVKANINGIAKSIYVNEKANNTNIKISEQSEVSFLIKRSDSTITGEKYIDIVSELPIYEEPKIISTPLAAISYSQETYLGSFTSTAYCTENYHHICNNGDATRTALGTSPIPYGSIAVDPKVIPLGTKLKVEDSYGNIYYVTATDTGGAIKGNKIDMVVDTHDNALQWGRRSVKIWQLS